MVLYAVSVWCYGRRGEWIRHPRLTATRTHDQQQALYYSERQLINFV